MQLNPVYLYPNRIDVYTNVPGSWTTERYRRVYNRNLKIYRGIDNPIDIQVRNSDEKAINLTGTDYSFVFNLVNRESRELVLSKDCSVVTLSSGKLNVELTASELYSLRPGFYQYSIYKEERTPDSNDATKYVAKKTPVYIDSQYGTEAVIEIKGDSQGDPLDSVEITKFLLLQPSVTGENGDPIYYSSLIDANYELSTSKSTHTFAFYLTNYSGQVTIEGSMYEGGTPTSWTTLDTLTFANDSLSYSNIEGKWKWLRVKHKPSIPNTGTFDKILYR
jgi:hypothetical protein